MKRKYVHEVLVNSLVKLAQEECEVMCVRYLNQVWHARIPRGSWGKTFLVTIKFSYHTFRE